MTTLDLNELEALKRAAKAGRVVNDLAPRPRVNWTLVITVVLAVLGWIFAGMGDYRRIDNRVTTLETHRTNDTQRLERLENKIDRILEQMSARGKDAR